ncbi:SDR family oxidoreductase [Paenirhodobacter sp. CAU 1674]|uniref:SDR family oxidoreductase n=1 Tax=Paenirhodobacter sp. CAU 1674 TaxID=3032596 RepID=UPI0023DBF5C5|nr:SDR family oxidoreductase [Paenirhodobacter sp. CAU 1674]MDF2143289.1 SDR family oxidoreductase [Paenirhodobacter sp. CAU 1674]
MSKKIALVTGASSGFGRLTALALARGGLGVYASMRDIAGRNADKARDLVEIGAAEGIDLRPLELDVQSEASVGAAVSAVLAESGQVDVMVHNAGHMMFGPAEAFTPDQLAQQYDVNVLGTQRINRALLPAMRARGDGLLVWISSSSVAGGTPPYLAPYFAAKAAMDSLALSYARELIRFGIETMLVVPGAFTKGTNHFPNAGHPTDAARLAEYEDSGPYQGFGAMVQKAFAEIVPDEADPATVAQMIAKAVARPRGKRPFRLHYDPSQDGAEVGFAVLDRLRAEMLHRVGMGDLLRLNA